jgi:hypothetical protein
MFRRSPRTATGDFIFTDQRGQRSRSAGFSSSRRTSGDPIMKLPPGYRPKTTPSSFSPAAPPCEKIFFQVPPAHLLFPIRRATR